MADLSKDSIVIEYLAQPDLKDIILIEGLPGVGNVGKIAADYIVEMTEAKHLANIYSRYFPPQVLIGEGGVIKLVRNELWYLKRQGKDDIVFLLGDHQAVSSEGQYEVVARIIEELHSKCGIKQILTLGGYGVGKLVENPRVLGAATSPDLVERFMDYGIVFSEDEPANGIVGASGLLLGIGKLHGIDGICLMGETSGYLLDPKSAKAIVEVLKRHLDMDLDMGDMVDKVAQLEAITKHLKAVEKSMVQDEKKREIDYIG